MIESIRCTGRGFKTRDWEPSGFETVVSARVGDTLGYYARVSTNDQNPDAQRARFIEAGAIRVFTDIVSGKRFDRPGLAYDPGGGASIPAWRRRPSFLGTGCCTVDGFKTRKHPP